MALLPNALVSLRDAWRAWLRARITITADVFVCVARQPWATALRASASPSTAFQPSSTPSQSSQLAGGGASLPRLH